MWFVLGKYLAFISGRWWLHVFIGLAVMLTLLSINSLGDALRDVRESGEIS